MRLPNQADNGMGGGKGGIVDSCVTPRGGDGLSVFVARRSAALSMRKIRGTHEIPAPTSGHLVLKEIPAKLAG